MSKRILMTEEQINFIIDLEGGTYTQWLINEAIRESYCIHQDVLDVTKDLSIKIQTEINNKENTKKEVEPGVILTKIYLQDYNIFDNKCGINVVNYNFKDRKIFDNLWPKYQNLLNTSGGIYYPSNKRWLSNIVTCSISGTLVKQISLDNIQHEIEHLFQQSEVHGELPKDKNYSMAYAIIRTGMSKYDELTIKIALLLYYSYSFEQDGFVNGLYQYLVNGERLFTWDDIKDSSAVNAIKQMRKEIEIVKNANKDNVSKILKHYFNLSYDRFINIISESEKRFIRKIGRVLHKHREEMIHNGAIIHEELNSKMFYFF